MFAAILSCLFILGSYGNVFCYKFFDLLHNQAVLFLSWNLLNFETKSTIMNKYQLLNTNKRNQNRMQEYNDYGMGMIYRKTNSMI